MTRAADIFDEAAYVYDGTLEGLLSAIFEAYANHESPSEVVRESDFQPRLGQRTYEVRTDMQLAMRVRKGLVAKGGKSAFSAVMKASCSSDASAGTAAYKFVRYVMDEHRSRLRPLSNIAHPKVAPIVAIKKSVENECEHMRQFVRFEHLKGADADFWFAKCNPRDSVVPLIMPHFVERFNVQPFMIFDEVHEVAGVYDGDGWHLVDARGAQDVGLNLPEHALEEQMMQDAWRSFYRTVAIDARYNPELRRHFMPKRLWRNLTEMQEGRGSLAIA